MNQDTTAVLESGQRRVKKDAATRWRKLVDDQRASGLPVSTFCRERGIAQSSLFAWRRRLSRAQTRKFVEVKATAGESTSSMADGGHGGSVELSLGGDRRLILRRGFDRELLRDLLDALERHS